MNLSSKPEGLGEALAQPGKDLLSLSEDELKSLLVSLGEKPFRAQQIRKWMLERGVLDPAEMTDLPKALRERLQAAGFTASGRIESVYEAADGTRKLLIEMVDGAKVECVLIPMKTYGNEYALYDEDEEEESPLDRLTLCISTQVGCAMGCTFCASGRSGLFRGLKASEIVLQVLLARTLLGKHENLRNLVFMGMGEPLHHYEQTRHALELLTSPQGLKMSPRRITVSTVGLVPGIDRLGQDFGGKIGLALSLHAPDDETRSRIMPMNQKYPVAELMRALSRYPAQPRRKVTVEYTLIFGQNDGLEQAQKLVRLLGKMRVKVNLIPMNPVDGSDLRGSAGEQVLRFREVLQKAGIDCFVRTRRGDDVSAACGQLALKSRLTSKTERKAGG